MRVQVPQAEQGLQGRLTRGRICGGKLAHLSARSSRAVLAKFATQHDLCCETYNIHDGQDVLLDVAASVVTHHHLVGHHKSFYVALAAYGALQGPLATADMMGRRLQRSLPPRCTLHGLLVWERLSAFTTSL